MKTLICLSVFAAFSGAVVTYAQSVEGLDLDALEARAETMASEAAELVEFVTSDANPHHSDAQAIVEQARQNAEDVNVSGVAGIDLESVIEAQGESDAKAVPLFMAFASLSLPEDSLKRLIADTSRAGGVVVFRGFPDGKASAFTNAMRAVVPKGANPNLAVDPRLFRAFSVDRVPTIVAASTEFTLCDQLDCVSPAPPHDRIAGNITIAYGTVLAPRTTIDASAIDLSGAQGVADDPRSFLGDTNPSGAAGDCTPLPRNEGGGSYEVSCNDGLTAGDIERSCRAEREFTFGYNWRFSYQCVDGSVGANGHISCAEFDGYARGRCTQTGSDLIEVCPGGDSFCYEPAVVELKTFSCPGSLGIAGGTPFRDYYVETETDNGGECPSISAGCTRTGRVCVDDSPQTRVVNGVTLTRDCWAWDDTYQCSGNVEANDCSQYAANPDCSHTRTECLSYDDAGNCTVEDVWYSCPLPGEDSGADRFVCGSDLYCIDGDCTQVEREASDEFGDALVAIQALGEVQDGFSPDEMRLFPGEDLRCSKKLFGLSNCCSGKGVPLLTPFLCNAEDRLVDERDDAGLCHYVGSYCSAKSLFVCTAKKQTYCCYESKLTRIIQQQGRAQLGKPWGDPETPDCAGFTVEEFQQLDLGQMDFSEVYAEFADAAKLPDEIEASVEIQERIDAYFQNATGGGST